MIKLCDDRLRAPHLNRDKLDVIMTEIRDMSPAARRAGSRQPIVGAAGRPAIGRAGAR
jgi:hypothetical protein